MHARERATLSVVFGLLAAVLPALVWAFVVRTFLRHPEAFHDQGGLAVILFFSPLALLVALAGGVPAVALAVAGFGRRGGWPAWRTAALGLSALGLLLALGTCIGPELLAGMFR
jgi:hypothetical protein